MVAGREVLFCNSCSIFVWACGRLKSTPYSLHQQNSALRPSLHPLPKSTTNASEPTMGNNGAPILGTRSIGVARQSFRSPRRFVAPPRRALPTTNYHRVLMFKQHENVRGWSILALRLPLHLSTSDFSSNAYGHTIIIARAVTQRIWNRHRRF